MGELSKYGFDHHSRYISDIQPQILAANLPNWVKYMESRSFTTEYTKEVTKGAMQDEEKIVFAPYAFDERKVTSKIFQDRETPTVEEDDDEERFFESNVKFTMLDIPNLHNFNEETAINLMRELGSTPNFAFFDSEVIQTLISYMF